MLHACRQFVYYTVHTAQTVPIQTRCLWEANTSFYVCVHRPPRWRNSCLLRFILYGMISKRKASPPTSTWRASRPYRPRWGIRGSGLFSFNESHDTMIYFKICCHLFSFLTLLFVSRTKQQGLEVSARKPLPLFCMLILDVCLLWCDLIVRCWIISWLLCNVRASKQPQKSERESSRWLVYERRPCNWLLESLMWQRRTNNASVSFTGSHRWTLVYSE